MEETILKFQPWLKYEYGLIHTHISTIAEIMVEIRMYGLIHTHISTLAEIWVWMKG